MPGAYSADLRERVLLACERGRLSRAKVARLFQVAESLVHRWLQTWRREGRRQATPHAGGPAPRLDAQALEKLRAMVAEANDLSLAEYAARLSEHAGVTVSGPTVCRALLKLRLPRTKTPRAIEQDRPDIIAARAAWRAALAEVDPRRLIFLDESGVDTRMTRVYARAAPGERAIGKLPGGRWERLTVIGARALDGVLASMRIAAAATGAVFLAFVEQVLIPVLRGRSDAIVVLDNLGAHKAEPVRNALKAANITYRYLPSYSPDLNPIEPCWSKLKGTLRAKAVRMLDALEAELGPALATITAQDAQGWFRLCGYSPTS